MITIQVNPTLVTFSGFHVLVVALLGIAAALCFKPQLWLPSLAVFWGLLTAFIDLLAREPQLPALMLLSSCLFLGFAQPSHAWRWALVVAGWIPAAAFVQSVMGMAALEPPGHPLSSFLAFVPALIGAYGGAFAARVVARKPVSSALPEIPNL